MISKITLLTLLVLGAACSKSYKLTNLNRNTESYIEHGLRPAVFNEPAASDKIVLEHENQQLTLEMFDTKIPHEHSLEVAIKLQSEESAICTLSTLTEKLSFNLASSDLIDTDAGTFSKQIGQFKVSAQLIKESFEIKEHHEALITPLTTSHMPSGTWTYRVSYDVYKISIRDLSNNLIYEAATPKENYSKRPKFF